MTHEQLCETVEKHGVSCKECTHLNTLPSCLFYVHLSGEWAAGMRGPSWTMGTVHACVANVAVRMEYRRPQVQGLIEGAGQPGLESARGAPAEAMGAWF